MIRLHSSLFKNAFYLMLSTFIVAILGFVFWVIVTRSYPSATVGLAATLLSVSGLLSMLSLAGFDTTFIRFLPKSARPNDHINSGLAIVALMSGVLSLGFVLLLPFLSPNLAFVLYNPWYTLSFVFFTIATALNVLTNAIFLSRKRAGDIFVINMLFSVLKVALPLLIIKGDVMTIFSIVGVSSIRWVDSEPWGVKDSVWVYLFAKSPPRYPSGYSKVFVFCVCVEYSEPTTTNIIAPYRGSSAGPRKRSVLLYSFYNRERTLYYRVRLDAVGIRRRLP